MLEKLVAIEVYRRVQETYYFKDGSECDFIKDIQWAQRAAQSSANQASHRRGESRTIGE